MRKSEELKAKYAGRENGKSVERENETEGKFRTFEREIRKIERAEKILNENSSEK